TKAVTVNESPHVIEIDTGVIRCRVLKQGLNIIESISRDQVEIAREVGLIGLRQKSAEVLFGGAIEQEVFAGEISSAKMEQQGPVRAVVKIEGKHRQLAASNRTWLPFVLRLYFYAGAESVRILHTIIYDGDPNQDFIRCLGLKLDVPMQSELHDRHVRFVGE